MRFRSHCSILVLLSIVTAMGCGKSKASSQQHKPTKEELALKSRKEIPGSITGRKWLIRWFNRSQTGNKGLELVLVADAANGVINDPDNPTVLMHIVKANIYKDGVHTAVITAPTVKANQLQHTLWASGGARVTSITDPPDTVITSDSMTLDTNTNILVATGHATATTITPDKQKSSTSGDRLVFDTKLKEMRNE